MLKATYLCSRCLMDQATHAVERSVSDPAERLSIMTGVMELLHKDFPRKIPAELGTLIHHYVMDRAGADPYAALKKKSNDVAVEVVRGLRQRNLSLRERACAAVAGNAIDFGVDGSRGALDVLEDELRRGLSIDHFERFRQALEPARKILYLTDNCGEIVFDGFLVEALIAMGKEVTLSPKARPILNDATVDDLVTLGLDRLAAIVPHTRNAIGLPLAEAPESFRQIWARADLIIAKGMGHFETLYGTDRPIVFLLKAKCIPVAESLGVAVGSHVLTF